MTNNRSQARRAGVVTRLAQGAAGLGTFLVLLSQATPAAAHDNLGGDEMSMAIAIFLTGCVLIAGASLAVLWAWRAGQFSNVEQAKYDMLKNAEDLDDLPIFTPADPPARLQGGSHAAK
jgi:nitrogen fixation-related uncharacterized protein